MTARVPTVEVGAPSVWAVRLCGFGFTVEGLTYNHVFQQSIFFFELNDGSCGRAPCCRRVLSALGFAQLPRRLTSSLPGVLRLQAPRTLTFLQAPRALHHRVRLSLPHLQDLALYVYCFVFREISFPPCCAAAAWLKCGPPKRSLKVCV